MPKFTRVFRATPGKNPFVSTYCLMDTIADKIHKAYLKETKQRKEFINSRLRYFYKEDLSIKDSAIGTFLIKITEMEEITNSTIGRISKTITDYIETDFYKVVNGKRTPISSENITKAYLAIKEGKSKEEVKTIING